jgi:hypothetical protein
MKMTLFVTSVCNLACAECIMQHQMKSAFRYQMSLEEVADFLRVSEESNYSFHIVLSGGEPLLWKNLEAGVTMLRASKAVRTITVFSNGIHYQKLNNRIVDMLDCLRVSHYKDVVGGSDNTEHIKAIKALYPKTTAVDRSRFWVNPDAPVAEYQPVACLNSERMFYDGRIYACPHAASIAIHARSDVQTSIPLQPHFMEQTGAIRSGFHQEICSRCISNNTVRKQSERTFNRNK